MNGAGLRDAPTALQEWRLNWLLVLSAMAGISLITVPSASLGLFMAPLEAEFGWSRTEISLGLTIFAVISLPLSPFAGVMVDRFGPRRVAVPGLAVTALIFACFGLTGAALWQWFAIWVVYTLVSLSVRTLVWNAAVSRAFAAGRGLALALVLSGTAIAQSLAPIVSHELIDAFGWRNAFFGLGLGWGGMAFVMVLLFFRIRTRGAQAGASAHQDAAPAPGMTAREAFRSPVMWRIALATFLQSTMVVAVMVHLVPMLVETGLSRTEAAGIAAILGVASITGKLTSGWLVDRFAGRLLPGATFAGPALGYLIILQGHQSPLLIPLGVAILGYCSGGCLQLTTYLTTRYAGLASFGTIFGIVSSLMALASGLGPLLAGAIFDITGSYVLLLGIGIPAALVAGTSLLGLGPYPDWDRKAAEAS